MTCYKCSRVRNEKLTGGLLTERYATFGRVVPAKPQGSRRLPRKFWRLFRAIRPFFFPRTSCLTGILATVFQHAFTVAKSQSCGKRFMGLELWGVIRRASQTRLAILMIPGFGPHGTEMLLQRLLARIPAWI
jgi:hypothetical protein